MSFYRTQSGVVARRASDFVASVGVNVHHTFLNTAYGDYEAWKARLLECGIRRVRTNFTPPDNPSNDLKIIDLAANGVRVMIIGWPAIPPQTYYDYLSGSMPLLGAIDFFEGPNETSDMAATRAWCEELWRLFRNDPLFDHVKIVAPSLAWNGTQTRFANRLGNLARVVDYGNIHGAKSGSKFDSFDGQMEAITRRVAPGRPALSSEEDWSTQQPKQADALWNPTAEGPCANIIARAFFENFRHGWLFTCPYEFVDQTADGSFESTFGWLRHDYSPKPTFTLVKAILALLADDDAPISASRMVYRLVGATDTTRSVLLQKTDGRFWLALWQQQEVWDAPAQQPIDVQPTPIVVETDESHDWTMYRPELGDTFPLESHAGTASFYVLSSPMITLLEIA